MRSISIVATPLSVVCHSAVEVACVCRCGHKTRYTLDFGPGGSRWRCGAFTCRVKTVESFKPVDMMLRDVRAAFEACAEPGEAYSLLRNNCIFWAYRLYDRLSGEARAPSNGDDADTRAGRCPSSRRQRKKAPGASAITDMASTADADGAGGASKKAGAAQRQPMDIREAITTVLGASMLDVPAQFHPVCVQLAFKALGIPVQVSELLHALYELAPPYKHQLYKYDEAIVSLSQAALAGEVNAALLTLKNLLVSIGINVVADLVKVSNVLLTKLYNAAQLSMQGKLAAAAVEMFGVLLLLNPVPRTFPVARLAYQCGCEFLLKASNHHAKKARAKVMRLQGGQLAAV